MNYLELLCELLELRLTKFLNEQEEFIPQTQTGVEASQYVRGLEKLFDQKNSETSINHELKYNEDNGHITVCGVDFVWVGCHDDNKMKLFALCAFDGEKSWTNWNEDVYNLGKIVDINMLTDQCEKQFNLAIQDEDFIEALFEMYLISYARYLALPLEILDY